MANEPIPAERRIDGMTGEVWRDGAFQADIVEITGTVRVERKEVPIPGSRSTHYKRGRVSREGSFRYQKVDDAREIEFLSLIKSMAQMRAERDAAIASGNPLPTSTFSMLISLDDPEAWGKSSLLLKGVTMWELPVGFNINDLVEREIPITWEDEEPISTIVRPQN